MIKQLFNLIRDPSCRMGTLRDDFSCFGTADAEFFDSFLIQDGFFNGRLKDEYILGLYLLALDELDDFKNPILDGYARHDERFLHPDPRPDIPSMTKCSRRLLLRLLALAIKGRRDQSDFKLVMKMRRRRPFFDDAPDVNLYAITRIAKKINWEK